MDKGSVQMDASPSAADAEDTEELPLGVLLFIPYRAMEAATMEGLARAGYTDMTVAQARIAARIDPGGSRITSSPQPHRSPSRLPASWSSGWNARAMSNESRTRPTAAPGWSRSPPEATRRGNRFSLPSPKSRRNGWRTSGPSGWRNCARR